MPASVPDEKDEQKREMIKSTLENGEQVGNLTLHIIQVPAPFFPLASTIVRYLSLRFAPVKLLTLGISTLSVSLSALDICLRLVIALRITSIFA